MSNAFPSAPITPPARGAAAQKESPAVNFLTHMMFAGGTAFGTSMIYAATYPIALMMKTDRSFFHYMSGTAAKCVALAGAGLGTYISVTGMQANREFMAARTEFVHGVQHVLMADLQMEEPIAAQKAAEFCARYFAAVEKNPPINDQQAQAMFAAMYEQSFLNDAKTDLAAKAKQTLVSQFNVSEADAHQIAENLKHSTLLGPDTDDLAPIIATLKSELHLSDAEAKTRAEGFKKKLDAELAKHPHATFEQMTSISVALAQSEFGDMQKQTIASHAAPTAPTHENLSATIHQGQVTAPTEKALA